MNLIPFRMQMPAWGPTPAIFYINVDTICAVLEHNQTSTTLLTTRGSHDIGLPAQEVVGMIPLTLCEVDGVSINPKNILYVKEDTDPLCPRLWVHFADNNVLINVSLKEFMDKIT